jgi:hypothetical protein
MESSGSRYERQSMQRYAREVRTLLPAAVFEHAPGRLVWLPIHLAIIVGLAIYVVRADPPWYVAALCAIVAGHSWGCLGFLAHEAMHHALVDDRRLERLVAWVGFLPYCLSPTLWSAWHNQAHHANTGKPVADPDGYGTLGFWQRAPSSAPSKRSRPAPAACAARSSRSSGSRCTRCSSWCSTAGATATTSASPGVPCTPSRPRCWRSGSGCWP